MTHSSPGPSVAGLSPALPAMARGALFALGVLFSMNLLNYVDRYVFAAVGPAIMRDIEPDPEKFGYLGSSFMIVYTIVSPLVGWLGDRYSRRKILAFGVGLWSVATAGTAFAANSGQMLLARALLGVGEASYGVVAPTLLADLFAPRLRGRVMGLFYLALPVGTAIGYGLGGSVQAITTAHAEAITRWAGGVGLGPIAWTLHGWRAAFWVVGIPGLVLAMAGLLIRDPGRGASEGKDHSRGPKPTAADYLAIVKTPSFLLNTGGMAAVTFTIGAYGHWMPTFFQYVHKTRPQDNLLIGVPLAVAGIVGVLLSMWLPDKLLKTTKRAYMLWAGSAVLLAIPFGTMGLLSPSKYVALGFLFVASVLLTSCLGPCNTITANVVPSNRRAAGFALSIFLLHLLGDIPSPPLIGRLSRELAEPAALASPMGKFFESIGARPAEPPAIEGAKAAADVHGATGPRNFTAGMLLIIPVLIAGSLCFLIGSKFLPADQDRARAAGGGDDGGGVPIH